MTQTSYNSSNPPPTLYHRCGQPVQVGDRMVGYSLITLFLVDGQAVRYCPRCGDRIWAQSLLRAEPQFCLQCGSISGECPLCEDCLTEADERDADHRENRELRFAAQCGIL